MQLLRTSNHARPILHLFDYLLTKIPHLAFQILFLRFKYALGTTCELKFQVFFSSMTFEPLKVEAAKKFPPDFIE